MFNRIKTFSIISLLAYFSLPLSSNAQSCEKLNLVGGDGTSITKTVSQPTIPGPFGITITSNNWNTDWAVSGRRDFKSFKATIVSEDGGTFSIEMYLKYSDQTHDIFFDRDSITLETNKPLIIEAKSRPDDQPYQVNLFVGGLENIGNSYQADVEGCY